MLITQNVPNLINGVSQQAKSLRYPSQCEEQVNYLPSVLRGLSKRPPSNHVKQIASADLLSGNYGVHKIRGSDGLYYQALLGNGAMKVFDLAGTEQPVTAPSGWGYLNCSDPAKQLRTLTVADYTFILNTTKV